MYLIPLKQDHLNNQISVAAGFTDLELYSANLPSCWQVLVGLWGIFHCILYKSNEKSPLTCKKNMRTWNIMKQELISGLWSMEQVLNCVIKSKHSFICLIISRVSNQLFAKAKLLPSNFTHSSETQRLLKLTVIIWIYQVNKRTESESKISKLSASSANFIIWRESASNILTSAIIMFRFAGFSYLVATITRSSSVFLPHRGWGSRRNLNIDVVAVPVLTALTLTRAARPAPSWRPPLIVRETLHWPGEGRAPLPDRSRSVHSANDHGG